MPWTYLGGKTDAFINATQGSHQQANTNSCWKSCTQHIVNWYRVRKGDNTSIREAEVSTFAGMASAVNSPSKHGHHANPDDSRLPRTDEIAQYLRSGVPILVNVGKPTNQILSASEPVLEAKGGHWMVVTGVETMSGGSSSSSSSASSGGNLELFDPATGSTLQCRYDNIHVEGEPYKSEGYVFNNSNYVDDWRTQAAIKVLIKEDQKAVQAAEAAERTKTSSSSSAATNS